MFTLLHYCIIALLVLAIVLLFMAVITILAGGAAFLVAFGDWIIAGIILTLLIRWIIKKVKNK